mgnify:CR=1 FL=1
MTNTQIKIRIQLDPSSTQQTASDPPDLESKADSGLSVDHEQVYDRRKLFFAASILLLILTGLIWLVSAMWGDDEIEPPLSSPELLSLSEVPTLAQIEQATMFPESATLQEAAPTHVIDAATDTEIAEIAPPAQKATPTTLKTGSAPAPIPQPIPAAKFASSPKNAEIPETSSTSSPQPVTTQVFRAQLTSAISQREPVDDIKQISLAGRSSRAIFLFLHLHDLTGETLRVNWFFQGRSVAQVLLPVGNNDWRTYSSKILNARRLGNWRVTAQDSSGNLLAEFLFEVTP